ncbi:MAG: hypothetical protein Q9188_005225 [Gyalolechia gomerana]
MTDSIKPPLAQTVKSPTSTSDWDKHLIEELKRAHGFFATERQYKRRISRWRLDKNVKDDEMRVIIATEATRLRQGKQSTFYVRDRQADPMKIKRFARRKRIDRTMSARDSPSTLPDAVRYELYNPYVTSSSSPQPPLQYITKEHSSSTQRNSAFHDLLQAAQSGHVVARQPSPTHLPQEQSSFRPGSQEQTSNSRDPIFGLILGPSGAQKDNVEASDVSEARLRTFLLQDDQFLLDQGLPDMDRPVSRPEEYLDSLRPQLHEYKALRYAHIEPPQAFDKAGYDKKPIIPTNRIALWTQDVFPSFRRALSGYGPSASQSNDQFGIAIMLASFHILSPNALGVSVPLQDHLHLASRIYEHRSAALSENAPIQADEIRELSHWFFEIYVMDALSKPYKSSPSKPILECSGRYQGYCNHQFMNRLSSTAELVGDFEEHEGMWHSSSMEKTSAEVPYYYTSRSAKLINMHCLGLYPVIWDVEDSKYKATEGLNGWAVAILLYRRVEGRSIYKPNVQHLVQRIFGVLEMVGPGDRRMQPSILFPLFIAGCEAMTVVERQLASIRFENLDKLED